MLVSIDLVIWVIARSIVSVWLGAGGVDHRFGHALRQPTDLAWSAVSTGVLSTDSCRSDDQGRAGPVRWESTGNDRRSDRCGSSFAGLVMNLVRACHEAVKFDNCHGFFVPRYGVDARD